MHLKYLFTRYELRRCVRTRTRAKCGRTCACACEIHSGKCAGCACVRPFFWRAMCDHTFAHFLGQDYQIMQLFALKTRSRTRMSYPVLDHLFLLWNILSCFRTSYSDLEHPILFVNTKKNHKNNEKLLKKWWKKIEKLLKNLILPKVRVRSATTPNWVCAHVCVRTLIWMCELRACDPKNGRNSHLGQSINNLA